MSCLVTRRHCLCRGPVSRVMRARLERLAVLNAWRNFGRPRISWFDNIIAWTGEPRLANPRYDVVKPGNPWSSEVLSLLPQGRSSSMLSCGILITCPKYRSFRDLMWVHFPFQPSSTSLQVEQYISPSSFDCIWSRITLSRILLACEIRAIVS